MNPKLYLFIETPLDVFQKKASVAYSQSLKLQDTFARCEKYSSKLDINRSSFTIFELKLQDTFARCEKYSSKLDIYRSLMRIFTNLFYRKTKSRQNE